MSVLESKTEKDTVKYAEGKGCLQFKINILGRKGWPDRIFLYYKGILFVEFKREGETPSKLQEYVHGLLRKHCFKVYVVDNYEDGKFVIDQFVSQWELG